MLSILVACALSSQQSRLIDSMEGLWRGDETAAIYHIKADGDITSFGEDLHGRIALVKATPEGTDLGAWAQTRRLGCTLGQKTLQKHETQWVVSGPRNLSDAAFTDNMVGDRGYQGWVRISKGPLNGSGQPAYYVLNRMTTRSLPYKSEYIYRLGSGDGISVAGEFKSTTTTLSIEEFDDSEHHCLGLKGMFTNSGNSAILQGVRDGTRFAFKLIDKSTGSIVGGGAGEWAPTSDTSKKWLDDGRIGDTDRIVIDFTFDYNRNKNGIHEYLTAAK